MKKKGFTLIELLAVIVILAIIAVIAVPRILNIVEDSKKSAAVSSALGYIDAIEKQIAVNAITGDTSIEVGEHDISYFADKVKVSGEVPKSGTITVGPKGKVSNYAVIINGYKVKPTKDNNDNLVVGKPVARKMGPITIHYHANGGTGEMEPTKDIVVANTFVPPADMLFKEWNTKADGTGKVYTSETPLDDDIDLYAIWELRRPIRIDVPGATHKGIVYMNPTNLTVECNESNSQIGTESAKPSGCMKFYIYDNSDNKYKMILDHNTTATVAWNSSGKSAAGMNEIQSALLRDTTGWKGVSKIISANEIAAITGNIGWDSATAPYTAWFYFDSNNQNKIADATNKSAYAWLFDYTNNCPNYGCNISGVTFGYWTSTAVHNGTESAWGIYYEGTLRYLKVSNNTYLGVRPVIELDQSEIK